MNARTITIALITPLIASFIAALLANPAAHAQTSGSVTISGKSASATLSFGEQERRTIEQYYVNERTRQESRHDDDEDGDKKHKKHKKNKEKGLPPGLQKKLDRDGQLPPGLQKRLSRGDAIPREVEKAPLPVELERKLVKLPPDYGRAVIGVDIVLFDKKSGIVLDIVGKLPL
ncbi:MAG: hypothetical protein JNM52_03490 [Betaproteobacteria bacterium]|nr:hypothetical protein [Betaproteobacteria bacterium]